MQAAMASVVICWPGFLESFRLQSHKNYVVLHGGCASVALWHLLNFRGIRQLHKQNAGSWTSVDHIVIMLIRHLRRTNSVGEKLSWFIWHLSDGLYIFYIIGEISKQIFGPSHRKCPDVFRLHWTKIADGFPDTRSSGLLHKDVALPCVLV